MYKLNKNNESEKYWNIFLKTGKVEDFLKYRKALKFNETNTNIDLEIGKINDKKQKNIKHKI